jgi:hypothetical protein
MLGKINNMGADSCRLTAIGTKITLKNLVVLVHIDCFLMPNVTEIRHWRSNEILEMMRDFTIKKQTKKYVTNTNFGKPVIIHSPHFHKSSHCPPPPPEVCLRSLS